MSNISSIIRNKAINTSHLSLSLNINNPYRSFYNLPIVSTFAKRDFPISILIPSFDNEEVNYLNSISFLAYINLTSSKIVLSRSGMVDCTFTKVSGNNSLYSCKTTGETLVVEGSNIKYIDDNKVSYYFSNNTGVSFINKVEFKDGYKLFVDIDKGVVTLSSAKLSDNNDLIYKAVLDCSKKEELKGSVYKELKGVRTLLSNIEISNRNIKIDCLISGDTLTTYVYKLGSKNIEYYKENKLKEEIRVEEVANTNNIKIETYEENIGRQKYLVEIDAFKVVLKDESYKGYEKSETYVVSPVSTSVEDVQIRSIYDSYGKVEVKKDTVGISKKDHIRYKGYIYDEETKLYYLISRYYDPEIGRFISPDSVEYIEPSSISGLNLYVYCCNDPINMYDPSGNFAISATLFISSIVVGSLISVVTSFYSSIKKW